ncbi:unnamed protein product [Mytilus coruscus]|uniref:Uncharacterized protein n=1 Tax=Mytilus coruscus TaxID=42192 RepID=A0A6J8CCQ3_MYTCO|nr:unnamed protein product [Mytilus coruscus]
MVKISNEESLNENSESDQTITKMASYADASKTENDKSNAQNSDNGFSAAKPVFILETDLFGTIKPNPVDFLNHAELNPKFVVKEYINYLRIRIKNVPLSADDNQIGRYLETEHNFNRERLRINGFLTNCQTGDRLFMVSPVPGIQLPRFISIGKYKALLIHKDQIVVNPYAKYNKCLQTGHKQETCDNDWVCNSCGK